MCHYKRVIIQMAFRWRADDGPALNAGLAAFWFFRESGSRNSIYLRFSSGGGGGGGPDPLSPIWIRTRHLPIMRMHSAILVPMKTRDLVPFEKSLLIPEIYNNVYIARHWCQSSKNKSCEHKIVFYLFYLMYPLYFGSFE